MESFTSSFSTNLSSFPSAKGEEEREREKKLAIQATVRSFAGLRNFSKIELQRHYRWRKDAAIILSCFSCAVSRKLCHRRDNSPANSQLGLPRIKVLASPLSQPSRPIEINCRRMESPLKKIVKERGKMGKLAEQPFSLP